MLITVRKQACMRALIGAHRGEHRRRVTGAPACMQVCITLLIGFPDARQGQASAEDAAEVAALLVAEKVDLLPEKELERLREVDSLTGQPRPDDILLFALPVRGPTRFACCPSAATHTPPCTACWPHHQIRACTAWIEEGCSS